MNSLGQTELHGVFQVLRDAGIEPAAPLEATRLAGGRSNDTFAISDRRQKWVLRMPPREGRTPSAHDVAREFRIAAALSNTEVPVSKPVVLCEDLSVLGVPFVITEFVEGATLQTRADLAHLSDNGLQMVVRALTNVLVDLHRVDYVAVGLEALARGPGFAERQLRRWSGQWDLVAPSARSVRVLASQLKARLAQTVPSREAATALVHGDFRVDNTLLLLEGGHVKIAAVIDWELCTVGDPVADVATTCAYRHPALDLILGLPSAWASERLPSAADLASTYESSGGWPLRNWEFFYALAFYKLAVIAAGIAFRSRHGAGSSHGTPERAVPELLTAGLATFREIA